MKLSVNGKMEQVGDRVKTLADLIGQYKLAALRVAVELNGRVVPRADHARIALREGDTLEIVTLVGGG